jgi:hypothetical protein
MQKMVQGVPRKVGINPKGSVIQTSSRLKKGNSGLNNSSELLLKMNIFSGYGKFFAR